MSLCCSDRIILTDVDDTLLKFSDAFQRWADQQGLERRACIHEAGTVEAALGITFDEAYPLVFEFLNSPIFGELEPEPCAAEVLPQLHRDGYKFVAISACEPTALTIAMREKNLREAFGFDFQDIFISGFKTGSGKGQFLSRYKPTVWVEDNFHHAVLGVELGHRSFLMNRSVNRGMHDDRVRRFNDWHDIGRLL